MILDKFLQFSDSQSLTATAVSTNVVDLGIDRNIGIGEKLAVVVNVEVAADATDANETYTVTVQTAPTSAFSSITSIGTITIPRGTVAGTKYVSGIPADLTPNRFIRLNYTLAGTTPSVTLSAHLMPSDNGIDSYVAYADGFTIS